MLRELAGKLRGYISGIRHGRLRGINVIGGRKAVCFFLIMVVAASMGAGLLPSMLSPVAADAGAWSVVGTPGSQSARNDMLNPVVDGLPTGSEIHNMVSGNDGVTIAAVVTVNGKSFDPAAASTPLSIIYSTNTGGISWSTDAYLRLINNHSWQAGRNVFNIAIACDSSNVWVASVGASGPKELWITTDAGQNWNLAFNGTGLDENESIRCLDISRDWGGNRDLAFGTVGGTAGGRWAVRGSGGFTTWAPQLNPNGVAAVPLGQPANSGLNFQAIKFPPNYSRNAALPGVDHSIAMICSDASATYYNLALQNDYAEGVSNETLGYVFTSPGIEVKKSESVTGASPGWSQLNRACLQLPSDFHGMSASLRRAYISLDAYSFQSVGSCEDGILRIDDATVYSLMDTTAAPGKSIYSIAYFGTYASGKLLAGERMGFPCTATVPTWFTDSPTFCPIPCWYPALKPATGAANQGDCTLSAKNGIGAALVGWNADGSLGLCATGSGIEVAGSSWWSPLLAAPIPNDESAFSITRNNAETWNQLGLIDTTIDWINDAAPSTDGTTVYLASANRANGSDCDEFDSVWRSTTNANVAAPLVVISPIGTYWERVLCRATAGNCAVTQSDLPILRIVSSRTDKPDGEIVAWAAQGAAATTGGAGGVMAWSPDYGEYWANITPKNVVQDFAFSSSTELYVLSPDGMVQRLPYTGTSWSTNLPTHSTGLQSLHTVTVSANSVLVGASAAANAAGYAASVSTDKGVSWSILQQKMPTSGNVHVAFDRNFAGNSVIYAADDNGPVLSAGSPHVAGSLPGAVYRNTAPASGAWGNIMSRVGGARGLNWWPSTTAGDPPHSTGQFGILMGWTESALFSAHDKISLQSAPGPTSTPVASAVCYTGSAGAAMPQPGIDWQCLNAYLSAGVGSTASDTVRFTLEPSSLKMGGSNPQLLYAIDDEAFGQYLGANTGYSPSVSPPVRGCLWSYTATILPAGDKIGAYLNGTWYMDYNGNGAWNGVAGGDKLYTFGNSSMTPITGNWNGTGGTEIGAYYNGTWYLDYNGNGVWNGTGGGDRLYSFGNSTMKPVTGDWNSDNKTEIGAYLNGTWYIDYNGNGVWNSTGGGDRLYTFGNASMKPVTGDWNNDGKTEIGAYLNGTWYLDYNGNGVWNGVAGGDRLYSFGNATMTPITGNWNGSGGTEIGAYLNGTWYLDYNGNGVWNGTGGGDKQYNFGNASMKPVSGAY